jgi:predicted transcriptional regulator
VREREKIGAAQLEVLRYIQDHQPVTVRQVAEHLAETRGLTRTTALNVMERLREKGFLDRELVEGIYHYSPSEPKPQFLRGLIRDFVQGALGGSLEPFVAYLAEEARLSDEEVERLQQRVHALREPPEADEP